jgi:hypothetical protein
MDTARLFTREDTITTGQPGVIAGGFLPPATLECDVVVRVTMQVPNNVYVQGTTRLSSGGAGLVTSEFTLPAGSSSVKSVRANVYATETGRLPVTADITYWPEGHPDLQRTVSGLTLYFDVNEPVESPTPTETPANDGQSAEATTTPAATSGPGPLWTRPLVLAIVGLTLVGTAAAVGARRIYVDT